MGRQGPCTFGHSRPSAAESRARRRTLTCPRVLSGTRVRGVLRPPAAVAGTAARYGVPGALEPLGPAQPTWYPFLRGAGLENSGKSCSGL